MLEPQQHTGSYYAASIDDRTDYGRLQGAQSADICVIGAGFTGISTALHLAERGYNVHVVEANKVGWGASGRNGGQVIGGMSGEETLARSLGPGGEKIVREMAWAGNQIIRERVETYGIQCDLKSGYLDVAIKPRHIRAMETEFEQLKNDNFPFEYKLLSRSEIQHIIGTDTYIGGLLNMGSGHLHPLKLCIGEARAAASLGVSIYEQSPVLRIEKGSKPSVVTEHGSVTADFIVLAGNAYHLLERKLRGIMFPVNSYIIATEPLPESVFNAINPQDLAVCDPNYILEYFRLSADKRLLFGGRCNYSGSDPEIIKRQLIPRMLKIYPQLAGTGIDFAWGGTIGVPINRVPQMGRISSNIFYSQGYSGHGVNVTHLAGQILADTIAGMSERFDIFANIKPTTVPGQHLLGGPMVALGMLYYKLRDKL